MKKAIFALMMILLCSFGYAAMPSNVGPDNKKANFPLDDEEHPGKQGLNNALQNVENEQARNRLQGVMNNLTAMQQQRVAEMQNIRFEQVNNNTFAAKGVKKSSLFGTGFFERNVEVTYRMNENGMARQPRNRFFEAVFPVE